MSSALRPFLLPAEQKLVLLEHYDVVCEDACLTSPESGLKAVASSKEWSVPGIYFWSMLTDSNEYRIYAGRTNSLSRRAAEYSRSFQPHSPNDYKLRIFQKEAKLWQPSTRFNLYFRGVPAQLLAAAEREAINSLQPILNARAKLGATDRESFQRAFEAFYAAGFRKYFAGDA